jgi:hypothetical protein
MTSQFDPESYLDATLESPSEKRPPLPTGRTYDAVLGEPVARSWTSKDGTSSGVALDIPAVIAVPEDIQPTVGGLTKLTVKGGCMLDLDDNGKIDETPGRNGKLRMYREATGQNNKGQAFTPRMLAGHNVKVSINHEVGKDGVTIYERVGLVGKA